jgi:hypothetical protein
MPALAPTLRPVAGLDVEVDWEGRTETVCVVMRAKGRARLLRMVRIEMVLFWRWKELSKLVYL